MHAVAFTQLFVRVRRTTAWVDDIHFARKHGSIPIIADMLGSLRSQVPAILRVRSCQRNDMRRALSADGLRARPVGYGQAPNAR